MGTRQLQIELLTPLWTGDAEKKGKIILETGILGSLRWWYEAILRGLGFHVCDPSQKACLYDGKGKLASICPACQLFGCTGYSRRFRLVINEDNNSNTGELLEIKLSNPGSSEHHGWRIPEDKSAEPLCLSLLPMRHGGLGEVERTSLHYTLRLIERYGALGAKTSQGQGVIRVNDWGDELPVSMDFDKWYDVLDKKERLKQVPEAHASDTENDIPKKAISLPDIRNLVGATVILEDAMLTPEEIWPKLGLTANTANYRRWSPEGMMNWLPSAPAVRAKLRQWLRAPNNFSLLYDEETLAIERHRIMGTTNAPWGDPVEGNSSKVRPKGSDVFITHLHRDSCNQQWAMRIFGFLPRYGNEADKALRMLLMDANRLKAEVQAALGGLAVRIALYPTDTKGLLVEGGKG